MRTVKSILSDRRRKRFRKRTFLGLTPVNKVNTIWGKSPAPYLEVYVLVLFTIATVVHQIHLIFWINDPDWKIYWAHDRKNPFKKQNEKIYQNVTSNFPQYYYGINDPSVQTSNTEEGIYIKLPSLSISDRSYLRLKLSWL